MSFIFHLKYYVLFAILFWALTAKGTDKFPGEENYAALYGEAIEFGANDLANGISILRVYRRGLDRCLTDQQGPSTEAFAKFLDRMVLTFRRHLASPQLRQKDYRTRVASYVTSCAAWIEHYAHLKSKIFNGGETRLDAGDEKLVGMTRQLQQRVPALLRVGTPSLEGTLASVKRADLEGMKQDGQFGPAAKAVASLSLPSEPYCKVAL